MDLRTQEQYGCSIDGTKDQDSHALAAASSMRCRLSIFPVVCVVNCVTPSPPSVEYTPKGEAHGEQQQQQKEHDLGEQQEYLRPGKKLTHYLLQLTPCQVPCNTSFARLASIASGYNSDNDDSTLGERNEAKGEYELAIG